MRRKQLSKPLALRGFFLGSFALLAVFASTAAPIPFYSLYQETIGLTNSEISYTIVAYLAGVICTLALAGKLSDALGRKPVAFTSVFIALMGCLIFVFADSATIIFLGRFTQGVAAGLAMSAISALIVDCIATLHLSWGSAMASCGSMFGIMCGSIGVGLIYTASQSLLMVYGVIGALLGISSILLMFVPEPLGVKQPMHKVTRIDIFIPRNALLLFSMSGLVYIITWSLGSFFQSFSAPVCVEYFMDNSTLSASLLLACAMAPSALGGPASARFNPISALRVGVILLFCAFVMLAYFINTGHQELFMCSAALFSFSMGVCVSTTLRMLLIIVDSCDTAGLISSLNLVAYVGNSFISILMGLAVATFSLLDILLAGALLAGGLAVVVFACTAFLKQAKMHQAS